MARYFRPLVLTAGRNKSAYFSRRDDSKLTSNRTLSQLYVDREAAERAIERYRKRHPMDEIVYSEIEEVDGSRESNPARHEIKLWRYDPIIGYWRVAQGPFDSAEVAAQYLAIFQKDEPGIVFKLSAKRPPYPKSSRKSNPGRSSLQRESSWVIVNRQTGKPILETFQKNVADKVNTQKYEVVPILRWLQRVNQKAREK